MSLRIGVIGCGFIGLTHGFSLRALMDARVVDAEVVFVHDSDPRKAEGLAGLVNARVASDAAEVVAASDAVWVCTPTSTHLELVRLVAEAGRAVFCEKPIGRTFGEATAVAELTADVPNQAGLVLRHAPVFTTLRRCLENGEFGRLMTILFRDDQFLPIQGHYASTWRADASIAGGGTLLEHSIHDIDLLTWLAGPVRSVSAHTSSFAGHTGIDDVAAVLLEFEQGRTATLTSVWHQVLSRPSTRRVEVFGEEAVVWLDDEWVGPLHVQTSEGVSVIDCQHPPWVGELNLDASVRDPVAVYAAANRGFIDALASGAAPQPGIHEALLAHELVDAAYISAANRRPVRLHGE